jgi:Icc-related predicted phosphoesterase
MEDSRTPTWPKHWSKVGCEPLGDLVESLRPGFVFCGHMHVPAKLQWHGTTIVALDNFAARPDQAFAILESDGNGLRLVVNA